MDKGIIKIIDYDAGNAPSVWHAVTETGYRAELCATPEGLKNAAGIILPGVGSAGATMCSLQKSGMTDALKEEVLRKKTPFLGVCVGMQILFEHSEEDDAGCFGWLKGRVKKFDSGLMRVPQMGWNHVRFKEKEIPPVSSDDYFYFVNSYYAVPADARDVWGEAEYGGVFTAAVRRGNIHGTQFHIEKSGASGLKLLKGFLSLC